MLLFRYTHGWDLLCKILGLTATVVLTLPGIVLLLFVGEQYHIPNIFVMISVFALISLLGWLLEAKTALNSHLPSYLYARFSLRIPLNWNEARELQSLFDGLDGTWCPLSEIRRLPSQFRLEAVRLASHVQDNPSLFELMAGRCEGLGYVPTGRLLSILRGDPTRRDPKSEACQLLGIGVKVESSSVEAAYARLASKLDPDRARISEAFVRAFALAKLQEIIEARDLLLRSARRGRR